MFSKIDLLAIVVGLAVGFAMQIWRDMGCPWSSRTLPTLLIIIDIGAAIVYGIEGGIAAWRDVVYWIAAATLTYVVTFDGKDRLSA